MIMGKERGMARQEDEKGRKGALRNKEKFLSFSHSHCCCYHVCRDSCPQIRHPM